MKILFVSSYYKPAFVYGGPTRSVSSLCEGLVQAGAEVTVLTTNANGATRLDVPTDRDLDVNGVKVHYCALAVGGFYFFSPSLASAVKKRVGNFDLVVAEILWSHVLGPTASACAQARRPFVVPTRGQLQPWALGQKSFKKRLYLRLVGRRNINRAAALHCTDYTEKEALNQLKLRPPTFVVPNGIDMSPYDHMPERGYWRRVFGIADGAKVLLYLGRLTQIKRPDIAIATLAACRSVQPDTHLILAGPDQDGMGETLGAQARQAGCADHIHLTGLLNPEQVRCALADADLLLAPSEIQENFGMAAAEALAAGVPVLVSNGIPVGQWAEQWDAGRVAPCQTAAFQQAAQSMIAQPAILANMGQNGRVLARSVFDVSVVAQQMIRHYEAIIAYGRPAEAS